MDYRKRKREKTSQDYSRIKFNKKPQDDDNSMTLTCLPKELQILILSYLEQHELVRVSSTCHSLHTMAQDPSLWRRLSLDYGTINNNNSVCKKLVSRCTQLKELEITGNRLPVINHKTGRTTMNSSKIMGVVLKSKKSLTSLAINIKKDLSNGSIAQISQMNKLRKLTIKGWMSHTKSEGFLRLAGLADLEELKFTSSHAYGGFVSSEAQATFFSSLKKLREIILPLSIQDEIVMSLARSNHGLERLSIIGIKLTGKSLQSLADNCPLLTHLSVAGCRATNADIHNFVSRQFNLKHLNLSITNVKDNTLLKLVQNCPSIEFIKLTDCRHITEGGIEELVKRANNLKHLDIEHAGVGGLTKTFCKRLVREHPETVIRYNVNPITFEEFDKCWPLINHES